MGFKASEDWDSPLTAAFVCASSLKILEASLIVYQSLRAATMPCKTFGPAI